MYLRYLRRLGRSDGIVGAKMMNTNVARILVLVSVLAVALLGSLAIANRSSDRDTATRQSIVTLCEKTNTGRATINASVDAVNTLNLSLRDALQIAQREKNQTTRDQVDYARIESALEQLRELDRLPVPDCNRDILMAP